MPILDTLEILIEADSRGLETQLKKAGTTISGFIEKMNSQEVNWQAILAGSLDTAIISGIASSFALAIEQAVQFQNATLNMNNIATPATKSFADSINQLGGQAYQLAQTSGQSLGDAASAFEAFSKAGLDASAATYAVNEASGIAYATNQDFSSVVTELVGLFQNWGITTIPQVSSALTGLGNAAQNGKFSFNELINALTPQGAVLSTKTNISDTAISLAELSTQSGLTKTAILDTFNQISTAAGQGLADPINNIVGSMSKYISSGPDGMITAFQKIGSFINQSGPAMAGVWGQAIGMMGADVASFQNTSLESFKKTAVAADELKGHLVPIDDIITANTSDTDKLAIAWNHFKTALSEFILPPAMKELQMLLDDMTGTIDLVAGFFAKAPTLINGLKGSGTGNVANSTPSGGLSLGLINGSSLLSNTSGLNDLGNSIATSIATFLSKNSNSNSNTPIQSSSQSSTSFNNTFNVNGNSSPAVTAQSITTSMYNQHLGTQ